MHAAIAAIELAPADGRYIVDPLLAVSHARLAKLKASHRNDCTNGARLAHASS